MSLKRALPREKFLSLQRQLQRSGELYEDRGFPPNFRSLFTKTRPSVNLQWKRPKVCLYSGGNTRLSFQVLNNFIFLVPCWNYLNHVASPLSSNHLRRIIFKSTGVKSVFFVTFCEKKQNEKSRLLNWFLFGEERCYSVPLKHSKALVLINNLYRPTSSWTKTLISFEPNSF